MAGAGGRSSARVMRGRGRDQVHKNRSAILEAYALVETGAFSTYLTNASPPKMEKMMKLR